MIENIQLAFGGIWSHKLRSILTMLGIIIGIAAIIAIVSTIQGTNDQIKQNLIGAGNNTVKVQLNQGDYPYDPQWGEPLVGVSPISEDIRQEIEQIDEVRKASVYSSRQWSENVYYQKNQFNGQILGIDNNYFEVTNYKANQGTLFMPKEYIDFSKVAIIDSVAANTLFPTEDPVGKFIDISSEPFKIVGVAEVQTQFTPVINNFNDYMMYNQEQSGTIFVPLQSWPIIYKFDEPNNLIIQAVETDAMPTAGKEAADILNGTIQSINSEESSISYKSENLLEQAQRLQELSNATNQQLIWIASISLLVGGIGVMNIMLVSVTERTKEIGLKKAIGARKSHVMSQFLTEAAVLTFIGGLIGVLAGIGLSQLISQFAGMPTAISLPIIIISVFFSMVIGLIFGLLPAIKASNLSPIDALRRE
ncbi:MAG TPA: FtsX-like permease family protein [Erysipelothrix sp.]|jgi:putative ABC transport system permease protein|nr:FtsX-like permease family protein [Erysipelothrix sp.]